jgi:cytochrome P450
MLTAPRTAGTDTSATAMRATLLCIMTNPRVYRMLMAEIDQALQDGTIPSGPREIVTEAQARELPYLQACIKEVGLHASRLMPASNWIVRVLDGIRR